MNIAALLGIEFPVIQAPMAGAQGSAMAIAVSEAGGLGSLPCALLAPEQIRNELAAIKAATSKPFNINFFCHAQPLVDPAREAGWRKTLAPYFSEFGIDAQAIPAGTGREPFTAEAAEVLAEFKPPVVSFHYGLPSQALLSRVKSWGAKVLSSATTVEEARWLERHGADVIIAQGLEAGGHRGMFLTHDLTTQVGTFALLPQIVRAVRVPVVAAGGMADADSLAAALAVGAAGIQAGTAYLLCPEATTTPLHRAALKRPTAVHTALTNVFTGRPARGIVNRVIRELGPINAGAPAFPLATSTMAVLRGKAESRGSDDFSPLWCGQNPLACREVPAGERTRQLAGATTAG
jgi:nitronate monooxygenase